MYLASSTTSSAQQTQRKHVPCHQFSMEVGAYAYRLGEILRCCTSSVIFEVVAESLSRERGSCRLNRSFWSNYYRQTPGSVVFNCLGFFFRLRLASDHQAAGYICYTKSRHRADVTVLLKKKECIPSVLIGISIRNGYRVEPGIPIAPVNASYYVTEQIDCHGPIARHWQAIGSCSY